ncbi:MAG: hypothetical protein PF541_18240 [Prolixibacteraceae bacterium]|jgi:hypothetical protein|nr:hypothetical protein [Prolixibacteraceae bacterium]
MNRIIVIVFLLFNLGVFAQENTNKINLKYRGQVSAYSHFNPSNGQQIWVGGRYLPQFNSELNLKESRLIDFEASANIYGNTAMNSWDETSSDGKIKPYRLWARYSSPQLEIRAGLQKINFGSASMLRPLMWFDQIDPRDPLKLTDGVWGILGRYYFLNNANVWLWGLYGNKNTKGWEMSKTAKGMPEFGGRIQIPIPLGEAAFSYHHRTANVQNPWMSVISESNIPENRLGFDVRLDWVVGCWVEASWIKKEADLGFYNNQEVLNVGMDYTLGIGSGIYIAFEQLLMAYDEKAFAFTNPVSFSLLSMSYPLGMFDNLNAIVYYDWKNSNAYNFVNYQHQFNNISMYVMGYWNPENYNIPTQGGSTNLFGGKGIQLMLVWDH